MSSEYIPPIDDHETMYLSANLDLTLNDLLARAQEKWGEEIDFDVISVALEEERTTHYNTYVYYEHDPDDYEKFIVLRKIR